MILTKQDNVNILAYVKTNSVFVKRASIRSTSKKKHWEENKFQALYSVVISLMCNDVVSP